MLSFAKAQTAHRGFFGLQLFTLAILASAAAACLCWSVCFIRYWKYGDDGIVQAPTLDQMGQTSTSEKLPSGKFSNLIYLLKTEITRGSAFFLKLSHGPFIWTVASSLVSLTCFYFAFAGLLVQSACCHIPCWRKCHEPEVSVDEIEMASFNAGSEPLIASTGPTDSFVRAPPRAGAADTQNPSACHALPPAAHSVSSAGRLQRTVRVSTSSLIARVTCSWVVGFCSLCLLGLSPCVRTSSYLQQRCLEAEVHFYQHWPALHCLKGPWPYCLAVKGTRLFEKAPLVPLATVQGGGQENPLRLLGTTKASRFVLEAATEECGCYQHSNLVLNTTGLSSSLPTASAEHLATVAECSSREDELSYLLAGATMECKMLLAGNAVPLDNCSQWCRLYVRRGGSYRGGGA